MVSKEIISFSKQVPEIADNSKNLELQTTFRRPIPDPDIGRIQVSVSGIGIGGERTERVTAMPPAPRELIFQPPPRDARLQVSMYPYPLSPWSDAS